MSSRPFIKMHGLGNDFIVTYTGDGWSRDDARRLAEEQCERRFGIGADSVLLVEWVDSDVVSFRIFERDGSESDMCGNGLRCVAHHAHMEGFDRWPLTVMTKSGSRTVTPCEEGYEVDLGPISVEHMSRYFDVDIGEPHRVALTKDLYDYDFETNAKIYKGSDDTNVNIVEVVDENHIKVRTYERGVESETLSCGTGMGACAAVLADSRKSDVTVEARGGNATVVFNSGHASLRAPAEYVYEGEISI